MLVFLIVSFKVDRVLRVGIYFTPTLFTDTVSEIEWHLLWLQTRFDVFNSFPDKLRREYFVDGFNQLECYPRF